MARNASYSTSFNDETLTFTKEFIGGRSVVVSFDDLPQKSQNHVIAYGLRQLHNDCHSGEKDIEEIFRLTSLKASDLMEGVIRQRAGAGVGVDIGLLAQALAAVSEKIETVEQAEEILAAMLPDTEVDDDDTIKAKKAKIRQIANVGAVKAKLDELRGKTVDDVLAI